MIDRRDMLKLALGSAAALASHALAQSPAKARTRIVFLGTKGGPRIGMEELLCERYAMRR